MYTRLTSLKVTYRDQGVGILPYSHELQYRYTGVITTVR